jgi:hypothetical protein
LEFIGGKPASVVGGEIPQDEKEFSMRNVIGPILVIAISCIAIGCASSVSPVTPAQLAETEATIRSAESAGAFERAPDLLQKARQALSAAQQASGKGDHTVAREHLLETTTYAEAARVRAEAEQKKSEAAMVRQQADEIEVKAKAMQKQLQVP